MSLYEQWLNVAYTQKKLNKRTWDEYLPVEQKIYEFFLSVKQNYLCGSICELAERFNMSLPFFVGFLDGINGALTIPVDIATVDENYNVDISFEWESLYKKMVEYKAEHLYNLDGWDGIFSQEDRERMYKEQKASKTVVNSNKVGRNDPCICGSGKKYKKCCGA